MVSLAGDTHNAWHNDLRTAAGQRVGAKFACSPGFEALLAGNAPAIQGFEQSNQLLIDDLQYLDASRHGFVLADTSTSTSATAQHHYVAGLDAENAATTIGKTVVES